MMRGDGLLLSVVTKFYSISVYKENIIKFRVWNILIEIKESVFYVIFNKDSGKI